MATKRRTNPVRPQPGPSVKVVVPKKEESRDCTSPVTGGEVRIGKDFQAVLPHMRDRSPEFERSRETPIWKPVEQLDKIDLEQYLKVAMENYNYSEEQALGLLNWYKNDIDKAMAELPLYVPYPDAWSAEDKVLFEQAFSFHGKSFGRVRQMLPDKSMGSLVNYYYIWKKSRNRGSYIDRTAGRALETEDGLPLVPPDGSILEFTKSTRCKNCGLPETDEMKLKVQTAPTGALCLTCFDFWIKNGKYPDVPDGVKNANEKRKRSKRYDGKGKNCPKALKVTEDQFVLFADKHGAGDKMLDEMDKIVRKLKTGSQDQEAECSKLTEGVASTLIDLEACGEFTSDPKERLMRKFSDYEVKLVLLCFRYYGLNFAKIADIMGNKTDVIVSSFYQENNDKYKIDEKIAEYEAEKAVTDCAMVMDPCNLKIE